MSTHIHTMRNERQKDMISAAVNRPQMPNENPSKNRKKKTNKLVKLKNIEGCLSFMAYQPL